MFFTSGSTFPLLAERAGHGNNLIIRITSQTSGIRHMNPYGKFVRLTFEKHSEIFFLLLPSRLGTPCLPFLYSGRGTAFNRNHSCCACYSVVLPQFNGWELTHRSGTVALPETRAALLQYFLKLSLCVLLGNSMTERSVIIKILRKFRILDSA